MTSVWLVSSGWYSDRRPVAIFTTREKAEAFIREAAKFDRDFDGEEPEEFVLDSAECHVPEEYRPYSIEVMRDGTVTVEAVESASWPMNRPHVFRRRNPYPPSLMGTVLARDEAHATKIAAEHWRRSVAENEWPDQKEPPA